MNVEGLWLSLQKHLFEPPREHYRIPLRVRGMLYQQQQGEDFISLSLSDAGLRFEFTRELVRNETVRLDIPLGGENITVDGKVIYCVPTRKSNRMVIGVVFDYRQKEVREVLRGFLVESTLLQVRRNMDGSRFAKALDFFDLDDFSRTRLLR